MMDAKKHVAEGERLNQALNGKLEELSESMKKLLLKYNLDSMPEVASDAFRYVLEELHLERFNPPTC
ncbi:MAG: hypothetical protein KH230_16405 [Enterocloster asparagiformis]|nr:hypothetical protein [Enterocloster asparagiformis]